MVANRSKKLTQDGTEQQNSSTKGGTLAHSIGQSKIKAEYIYFDNVLGV